MRMGAIYARVSSEQQRQENTVARSRELVLWNIKRVYNFFRLRPERPLGERWFLEGANVR